MRASISIADLVLHQFPEMRESTVPLELDDRMIPLLQGIAS